MKKYHLIALIFLAFACNRPAGDDNSNNTSGDDKQEITTEAREEKRAERKAVRGVEKQERQEKKRAERGDTGEEDTLERYVTKLKSLIDLDEGQTVRLESMIANSNYNDLSNAEEKNTAKKELKEALLKLLTPAQKIILQEKGLTRKNSQKEEKRRKKLEQY